MNIKLSFSPGKHSLTGCWFLKLFGLSAPPATPKGNRMSLIETFLAIVKEKTYLQSLYIIPAVHYELLMICERANLRHGGSYHSKAVNIDLHAQLAIFQVLFGQVCQGAAHCRGLSHAACLPWSSAGATTNPRQAKVAQLRFQMFP